jgi:hypothetical protein
MEETKSQATRNGMEDNEMELKARPMLGAQSIYLQHKVQVILSADRRVQCVTSSRYEGSCRRPAERGRMRRRQTRGCARDVGSITRSPGNDAKLDEVGHSVLFSTAA